MNIAWHYPKTPIPALRLVRARRALRHGARPLAGSVTKVAAWLTEILDPDLGRGWRCTLHAFGPGGAFTRVQAAAFDPEQAVEMTVARLRRRLAQPSTGGTTAGAYTKAPAGR